MKSLEIEMKAVRKHHFIGIGGIGMSGLARILRKMDVSVSGSDLKINERIKDLKKIGVEISLQKENKSLPKDATVVFSSAIPKENAEMQEAIINKFPLLHRSELLSQLTKGKNLLAVSGTHGKTTTSSLLACVLIEAGLTPSYSLGGVLEQYSLNADFGKGNYFVIEADESDGSFLNYYPHAAIITNIEWDHVDYYESLEQNLQAFKKFTDNVKEQSLLFWNGDDPLSKKMKLPGKTFGFGDSCDIQISNYSQKHWKANFTLSFEGKEYSMTTSMVGKHNAYNAAGVFGLVVTLGIDPKIFMKSLGDFQGVQRRQTRKQIKNMTLIDDYAHHPTEVEVTLKCVSDAIENNLLKVVFQPHRFSRIDQFFNEFANSLRFADELIVTDVHSAGEKGEFNQDKFLDKVTQYSPGTCVKYIPYDDLKKECISSLRQGDTLVTLGAGSITNLHNSLINYYTDNDPSKYVVGVICGGNSEEHDVSIKSSKNVAKWLVEANFEVRIFYISRNGKWHSFTSQLDFLRFKNGLEKKDSLNFFDKETLENLQSVDVCFPVLHGTHGEDGMIQGFLKTLGKPFVGCSYSSCALCMEKIWSKNVVDSHGILLSKYQALQKLQWQEKEKSLTMLTKKLEFPLFVKPANLGSSIGISRTENLQELEIALDKSFSYDDWSIIEEEVKGREIEFAVLGNQDYLVFGPGEVLIEEGFYDYEKKFIDPSKAKLRQKIDLDEKLVSEGKEIVKKIAGILRCRGFVRIDMFLDDKGRFFFNEVNPIPGMTDTSLYPLMLQSEGVSNSEMVKSLVALAFKESFGRVC
jgi:UDP-N-acetylmuramate--alanine ligase